MPEVRLGSVKPEASVAPKRGFVQHSGQSPTPTGRFRQRPMIDFFRDLWDFLRIRKKIWLLPIIVLMVILGGLIIVSQQSVLGSFIYTLF